jgi:hypothetical protein
MLKKIRFSTDFKKLHCRTSLDGPGQKNLAHRQDGPEFSGPEIWARQNGYVILMDGPGHKIDVLPAYPAHLPSLSTTL